MRGRKLWIPAVSLLGLGGISLAAQTATSPPPPQTARAALIEMFLGKGKDDFTKHLPDAMREVLIRKGDSPESSIVFRISTIGRGLSEQGGHVETFESGPNILVSDERGGHEGVEVAVERDSLQSEEDEIELSIHFYKDGELQSLPIVPQLIFTMKQEKEIWRLAEVTIAGHVPLTDPDYLKGLRKEQDKANELAAQARMAMIAEAENQYAASHADKGFSCTLASLLPPAQTNSSAAAYNSPSLADEEADGYRFALSGCDGSPAIKYRLTATPLDPGAEIHALCVDQSGNVKSTSQENASNCLSGGQVINGLTLSKQQD